MKYVVSEILQDYLKNVDKFKTKDILKRQVSETITLDKTKYTNLKNSYTKLSMLLVFYEKILLEIALKLIKDLSNINYFNKKLFNYLNMSQMNIRIRLLILIKI